MSDLINSQLREKAEAWQKANPLTFLQRHKAKQEELLEKYGPDFEQRASKFEVNKAEQYVINEWLESLRSEILDLEKKASRGDPLEMDAPYYGAIGGGVKYSFTPTGLGSILTVTESTTGKELNVTAALDWFFFG